jgi:site-specific DNA recombinase
VRLLPSAVREAIEALDPIWDELFPAEQARIVQLLVERVDVSPEGVKTRLRTNGIASLIGDLRRSAAPLRVASWTTRTPARTSPP